MKKGSDINRNVLYFQIMFHKKVSTITDNCFLPVTTTSVSIPNTSETLESSLNESVKMIMM